jgi:hypothetical protein
MRNEQSFNRPAGRSGHPHHQPQQPQPQRRPAYYGGQPQPSQMAEQISRLVAIGAQAPRQVAIGVILAVALFAFEVFNYDTTRFALQNLLGPISFVGLQWASILALAFCAIDFAGLVRLFTPGKGKDEPKEVWYLMGAWLLGATMNAMMTWWAVSLTLLSHDFGNEVLSREQLLQIVPVFVAVLVWLTRILFIGAITMAGDQLLDFRKKQPGTVAQPGRQPAVGMNRPQAASLPRELEYGSVSDELPSFLNQRGQQRSVMAAPPAPPEPVYHQPQPQQESLNLTTPVNQPARQNPKSQQPATTNNNRVRQRPPMPNAGMPAPANGVRRAPLGGGIQARGGKIEG